MWYGGLTDVKETLLMNERKQEPLLMMMLLPIDGLLLDFGWKEGSFLRYGGTRGDCILISIPKQNTPIFRQHTHCIWYGMVWYVQTNNDEAIIIGLFPFSLFCRDLVFFFPHEHEPPISSQLKEVVYQTTPLFLSNKF
jgi:hypothetical protein